LPFGSQSENPKLPIESKYQTMDGNIEPLLKNDRSSSFYNWPTENDYADMYKLRERPNADVFNGYSQNKRLFSSDDKRDVTVSIPLAHLSRLN